MNGPNLFGVKPKSRLKKADPLPPLTMNRLLGLWTDLFAARYHEKPMIRPRDAAALKRMVLKSSEVVVAGRLKLYLELEDDFVQAEGFPLALMEDRWNKLIAASWKPQSKVQDAESTERYLQSLRRR